MSGSAKRSSYRVVSETRLVQPQSYNSLKQVEEENECKSKLPEKSSEQKTNQGLDNRSKSLDEEYSWWKRWYGNEWFQNSKEEEATGRRGG